MNFSLWIDCVLVFICFLQTFKIAFMAKELRRQWEIIEHLIRQVHWQNERINGVESKVLNLTDRMKRGRKQEKSNLE